MSWDLTLQTPFNCIISGISQSGKTTFMRNLLQMRNYIFSTPPKHVIMFYKIQQDIYDQMLEEKSINELININDSDLSFDSINEKISNYKDEGGSLIIFDDSMTDIYKDFEQIFTNISHHNNCSIIFVTQNLFYKDKSYRTMSLNVHYFIIMKNNRDQQQVANLARQISPHNSIYVTKSYENATKFPYSYLMIDFKPNTPPALRLRTNILPHEFPLTVYLENEGK
jgi:hypothetical protein